MKSTSELITIVKHWVKTISDEDPKDVIVVSSNSKMGSLTLMVITAVIQMVSVTASYHRETGYRQGYVKPLDGDGVAHTNCGVALTPIRVSKEHGMAQCAWACLRNEDCLALNWNENEKICQLVDTESLDTLGEMTGFSYIPSKSTSYDQASIGRSNQLIH